MAEHSTAMPNAEALQLLHTGGIIEVISIQAGDLPGVLERLTSCHNHVFVVDQSTNSQGWVTLGLSKTSIQCVHRYFAELV